VLIIMKPETEISWHRRGFRLFGPGFPVKKRYGRPRASPEIRALIRKMAAANPLRGAHRIHGELLKLGIEISERIASRLLPGNRRPPSQTWKTFLDNHFGDLVSVEFFSCRWCWLTVGAAWFISTSPAIPTAAWTAQQVREAFPEDRVARYLIRDRDGVCGSSGTACGKWTSAKCSPRPRARGKTKFLRRRFIARSHALICR